MNQNYDQNGQDQRNYQSYQPTNQNSSQQYPYGVPQQNDFVPETEAPMTVGQWILTMFVSSLPCIGIIMLFVWAFGNEPGKKSRANYCKAVLIIALILLVLEIILGIIIAATGALVSDSFGNLFNNL